MVTRFYLTQEAKAWLKRKNGPDEIIKILPDTPAMRGGQCYQLFTAYDDPAVPIGQILFDTAGYWIYDGCDLSITEQEQVAAFIINYRERL